MRTVSHLKRDRGRASRRVDLALNELLRRCRGAAAPARHLPEQIRNLCKRVRPLESLRGEELALRNKGNVPAVDELTPHGRGA